MRVRKTDGSLALRGKGRAELCKALFEFRDKPPVKKNKKRGTQKFWFFFKEKPLTEVSKKELFFYEEK